MFCAKIWKHYTGWQNPSTNNHLKVLISNSICNFCYSALFCVYVIAVKIKSLHFIQDWKTRIFLICCACSEEYCILWLKSDITGLKVWCLMLERVFLWVFNDGVELPHTLFYQLLTFCHESDNKTIRKLCFCFSAVKSNPELFLALREFMHWE